MIKEVIALMGRREVKAHDGEENDVKSRWCRKYLSYYSRPGKARYGKNLLSRRQRRFDKTLILSELSDWAFGFDSD